MHALGQPHEVPFALFRVEAAGLALERASPPFEHRFRNLRRGDGGPVQAAFQHFRRGAKIVFEKQGFAESEQQFQLIALLERARAHGAQRFARGAEIGRIGPFAVALEQRARQHDGAGVGGLGEAARRAGRDDGLVEAPLVVGRARTCEVRTARSARRRVRRSSVTAIASAASVTNDMKRWRRTDAGMRSS